MVGLKNTICCDVCSNQLPRHCGQQSMFLEQEKGYNGFTADLWSCGVILFVMLAGYLPFDDPNMNALFNKIERGEFRMAKYFSPEVKDLISKVSRGKSYGPSRIVW